jgi:hypothetical protein
MAELDPRLLPVLDAVMRSPLAPLGTSAMERLDAADADRFRFDDDRDPLAPSPEESDVVRANRQLKILDAVIGGRLRMELELLERSQSLAREIASRPGARSFESFATVLIMPDAADSKLQEGNGGEDLLSGARRLRLERTLNAWNRAIGITGIATGEPQER